MMCLKILIVLFVTLLNVNCSSENGRGSDPWQSETLLQLDELRQKQIILEKDMIALKAQLAEAEKPEAVPKPAEKKS